MKIYLAHSTSHDFHSQLYEPLQALTNGHTFIFPHDDDTFTNSKDTIPTCDLILAEVSYPSTGQGIELGWANSHGVPIVCIHKAGSAPSGSLPAVCDTFIEYSSSGNMIEKLRILLNKNY